MRIPEIDALKAIAIVGVIFAHANFEKRLDLQALEIVRTIQLALGWCVIAFFWASGFLIKNTPSNLEEVCAFIRKRFMRLVIPCIVFSITYKMILIGIHLTGKFSWESPFPSDLLSVYKLFIFPVGPQFYFLYYLFGVSVALVILNLFFSIKYIYRASLLVFVIIYFFIDVSPIGYGNNYNLLMYYFVSYVSGAYYSIPCNNGDKKYIFLLVFSVFITAIHTKHASPLYILIPFLLQAIFKKFSNLTRALNRLRVGEFSPGIYVWHAPIVMPFISIVCTQFIGSRSIVVVGPIVFLTIVTCIFLSLTTSKISYFKLWRF